MMSIYSYVIFGCHSYLNFLSGNILALAAQPRLDNIVFIQMVCCTLDFLYIMKRFGC